MTPTILTVKLAGGFVLRACMTDGELARIVFRVGRDGDDDGIETSDVAALVLLQMVQLNPRGT